MKGLRNFWTSLRDHQAPSAEAFLAATHIDDVIANAPAMRDAILHCPTSRAATLLEKLKSFRKTSPAAEYATSSLVYATRGDGRLTKILTVLHLAGFEISQLSSLPFESTRLRDFATHLDEKGKSAHRRMEAFRLEPEPAEVLARPWWQDFYGQNLSRFPGDLKIWQRFVLPLVDPRSTWGAILVLAISGGLLGAFFFRITFSF